MPPVDLPPGDVFLRIATGFGILLDVLQTLAAQVLPPKITLIALPASIEPGQSATVSWATENVDVIKLDGESVAPIGSKIVSPTTDQDYTLSTSGIGGVSSATVSVRVGAAPPIDPPPPPPPSASEPSPDGTQITAPTAAVIIDSALASWSFGSTLVNGGYPISRNGLLTGGAALTMGILANIIYVRNDQAKWYKWTGTAWQAITTAPEFQITA